MNAMDLSSPLSIIWERKLFPCYTLRHYVSKLGTLSSNSVSKALLLPVMFDLAPFLIRKS